jgi:hypothetical protein
MHQHAHALRRTDGHTDRLLLVEILWDLKGTFAALLCLQQHDGVTDCCWQLRISTWNIDV